MKRQRVAGRATLASVAVALLMSSIPSAGQSASPPPSGPPTVRYQVVACYPHDPAAFTQGLLVRNGQLYESTGLNGRSSLRRVRLETGAVEQKRDVARRYFAEGLAEFGGELFQLTWETGVAFVYDAATFAPRRQLRYRGEGWGLTSDGAQLIMSDGSSTLQWLDPRTFAVTKRLPVTDDGRPVERLNELEFIKGHLFANVWLTDQIVIINPGTGRVEARLDLAALNPQLPAGNAVLNGIAYDRDRNHLFVTGKLWPTLYEIALLWEDIGIKPAADAAARGKGCP